MPSRQSSPTAADKNWNESASASRLRPAHPVLPHPRADYSSTRDPPLPARSAAEAEQTRAKEEGKLRVSSCTPPAEHQKIAGWHQVHREDQGHGQAADN